MKAFLFFVLSLSLSCMVAASSTAQKGPEVVILLGAPACGKGTQATILSKDKGLPQISTGDLFRENIQNKTELGQKAKVFMDEGKLVPDSLVLDMLFDRLGKSDASQGYILDGFPRTLTQAETLEKKLPKDAMIIVLNFVVSDETIIKRALGRKRSDDTPAIIKERLKNYYTQTAPLIEFYTKKGLLKNIDGEKSCEEVSKELKKAVAL